MTWLNISNKIIGANVNLKPLNHCSALASRHKYEINANETNRSPIKRNVLCSSFLLLKKAGRADKKIKIRSKSRISDIWINPVRLISQELKGINIISVIKKNSVNLFSIKYSL